MHILHHTLRRPATFLAMALALIALLTAPGCGSAAQSDPADTPTQSAPLTTGGSGHQSGPAESQPAQSDNHSQSNSEASGSEGHHNNDEATKENPPGHNGQGAQGGALGSDTKVINMNIVTRNSSLSRRDLQVKRGDTVSINFTADEAGEIHLHGYDMTAAVSPDAPGTLNFVAETAGAFALNFHVFASEDTEATGDHHVAETPEIVVSETPVSVDITAEPDAHGGVDVYIVTRGVRFAPELVDQVHTPGAGHAHIYVDGTKLGRVFEDEYHVAELAPGEHEIRISLNTNDHGKLAFGGKRVESIATVTVPDVGQGHGDGQGRQRADGHGHSHESPGDRDEIAEVHLGNLEVYP